MALTLIPSFLKQQPKRVLLPCGHFPLETPLVPDPATGWKMYPLFRGHTQSLDILSCHASSLIPGKCPHPPHQHNEEEFLLILHGEVDLILPQDTASGPGRRQRLTAGQFSYYPAGFPHTLEPVGSEPANYLMLKWAGPNVQSSSPLCFHIGAIVSTGSNNTPSGFSARLLTEGPTSFLRKFHVHQSTLLPGGGYKSHQDEHDVVLIVLEGTIETLGLRAKAHDVIYCAAGVPHAMLNPGSQPARYLALEFHGIQEQPHAVSRLAVFIKAHVQNESRLMKARLAKLFRGSRTSSP